MNYRHSFHAGNFADVLKHLLVVACLNHLQKKEAGLFVLDAFAGIGLYDLHLEEAARSPEYLDGIVKLWDADKAKMPIAIKNYLEILEAATGANQRFYAGTPYLICEMLRKQDRGIFNELHPLQNEALSNNYTQYKESHGKRNVKILAQDGWNVIKSTLPPPERRGLIIIDPPFEIEGEFDRMIEATKEGLKRFATGVFLLWHADKDEKQTQKYQNQMGKLGKEALFVNMRIANEDQTSGLKSNGVTIINPPFGLKEQISDAMGTLTSILSKNNGAKFEIRRISAAL